MLQCETIGDFIRQVVLSGFGWVSFIVQSKVRLAWKGSGEPIISLMFPPQEAFYFIFTSVWCFGTLINLVL